MTSPIVLAQGLRKRFGARVVVRDLDLAIPPGICFGLLGPNGAGKTTTLRMLLGQSPLDGGRLDVFGLPMPQAARDIRARTGVVPQMDNLDPDFTVVENLRIYGRYFGIRPRELETRINELLDFADLSDRADARIPALSGGMRRRLVIARALINDPELVILDEPSAGLDPQVRHVIWARLRELRQAGKTLLLTTHYMDEAERLCDELVIMDHGRVLEHGSPASLIRRHVEPEVIEIRGEARAIRAAVAATRDCRTDTVGDTFYCYTRDARTLVSALERDPGLVFLHRPGNLEDVFLKLTGRELRD